MEATMTNQAHFDGFNKSGTFPVNRKRVLDMLPSEDTNQNKENDSTTEINECLTTFLKEMYYGDEDAQKTRACKKKLNVPAGRSSILADFEKSGEEGNSSDGGVEYDGEESGIDKLESDSSGNYLHINQIFRMYFVNNIEVAKNEIECNLNILCSLGLL